MPVATHPIKFGTDGWRGVIAADFTFERVNYLAPLAAQVLADNYGNVNNNRLVIVGYDRRFMAEEFAKSAAEAIQSAGFDVWLSQTYAPTPAFSWAAKAHDALGAIVMTASHNPANYLGLKVKGAFGGSVSPEITKQIESLLGQEKIIASKPGRLEIFDPWESYVAGLRAKVNIEAIKDAVATGKIQVFADVMHGAAAGGLAKLLGIEINELNGDRDPLFGGHAPEPLPHNLTQFLTTIKEESEKGDDILRVGFAFDGDCDRIAASDGNGNFLSSQILIPILIEHLSQRKGLTGEVVKTVSGSDFIPQVAESFGLSLHQTPIGYKYIADRMLATQVLIGGEESGGVGYGHHIPERDALMSALFVLEAMVESGKDLGTLYSQLQKKLGFNAAYNRIDLPLASMDVRTKLLERLENEPIKTVAGKEVTDCLTADGYKLRLDDNSWLLIRFSGTEPLLRLYCEASTIKDVQETLAWAKDWAIS